MNKRRRFKAKARRRFNDPNVETRNWKLFLIREKRNMMRLFHVSLIGFEMRYGHTFERGPIPYGR